MYKLDPVVVVSLGSYFLLLGLEGEWRLSEYKMMSHSKQKPVIVEDVVSRIISHKDKV